MTKIIVTGRTSFIGRQFVNDVLKNTDWLVYSLERLPFRPAGSERIKQFFHDLRAEIPRHIVEAVKDADVIVHFAADVSGIKSLEDPRLSVETNVKGTFNVLEFARRINIGKFIQISTGEVVGSAPFPFFLDEKSPLRPSNPYAASKAAAEALVNSYRVSFGVPSVIIRSMNVFGVGQSTDRFVPGVINKLRRGERIKCHVGKDGTRGSRCWLYVNRFSKILLGLISASQVGETYHVVGPERNNEQVIDILAKALDFDYEIDYVEAGPSHDLRYALKNSKLPYLDSGFERSTDLDLAFTAVRTGVS